MDRIKTYRPRLSLREAWAIFCALGLIIAGCHSRATSEPTIAAQAAQVRSGIRDSIQVEAVPLSDHDLESIRDLTSLEALLLDHPDSQFTAHGLEYLAGLSSLKHLRIRGGIVDDDCLEQIAKLQSLRILNLPHSAVSAAGLAHLENLPALEQLRLGSPNLNLAAIDAIAVLPALKRLHLIDIPVGDAGLQKLAKMDRLESLYLDGADLSDAAVDELFRARPQLHVHFDQEHHDRDPSRHSHAP